MELKDHALDNFLVMKADSFQVQLLIMEHCTSGGSIFPLGQDYLLCQPHFQEFHHEILKIRSVHCKVNKVHLQLREYYFTVLTTCKPRVNDS